MDLFNLREEFNRHGIMICFNGPFSHSIIEEVGLAVRNHLAAENLTRAAVQDVFSVYIELAQNVKNYMQVRQLPADAANSSIIVIAKQNGRYLVTSGNIILEKDAVPLAEAIDRINALDAQGLKKLYREQMRKTPEPGSLGAGLGLLEIARRSSDKMTYSITPVDGGRSFLRLSAYV